MSFELLLMHLLTSSVVFRYVAENENKDTALFFLFKFLKYGNVKKSEIRQLRYIKLFKTRISDANILGQTIRISRTTGHFI